MSLMRESHHGKNQNIRMLLIALDGCILGTLIFTAGIFLFILIINGMGWAPGTEPWNLPIEAYLLIKTLEALLLTLLLVRHPRYEVQITCLIVLSFGLLLFDTEFTMQHTLIGSLMISSMLAVFLVLPVTTLALHFCTRRVVAE
ncbi:MAG: hypothetical protein WCX22_10720 [Methanoregula sp.]